MPIAIIISFASFHWLNWIKEYRYFSSSYLWMVFFTFSITIPFLITDVMPIRVTVSDG